MGQYHILVNVDKKEKVEPHGLGLGLKQYEHTGNFEGTLADAMYILMMTSPARGGGDFPATEISGRWKGDRVLILGTKLKLFEIKGFDTTAVLQDYTRELDKWKASESGADTLSLSPRYPNLLLTQNNIPDTGFGNSTS